MKKNWFGIIGELHIKLSGWKKDWTFQIMLYWPMIFIIHRTMIIDFYPPLHYFRIFPNLKNQLSFMVAQKSLFVCLLNDRSQSLTLQLFFLLFLISKLKVINITFFFKCKTWVTGKLLIKLSGWEKCWTFQVLLLPMILLIIHHSIITDFLPSYHYFRHFSQSEKSTFFRGSTEIFICLLTLIGHNH